MLYFDTLQKPACIWFQGKLQEYATKYKLTGLACNCVRRREKKRTPKAGPLKDFYLKTNI